MVTSCMLCFHCIDSLPVAPIDLEPALLHSGIFSSRELTEFRTSDLGPLAPAYGDKG